jgi:hypothetical protein
MHNLDQVYIVITVFLSLFVGAFLMWIHYSIKDDIKNKIIEDLKADKAFYAQMLKKRLSIEEQRLKNAADVEFEECPKQKIPPVMPQIRQKK